jgi:hypothetical protein
MRVISNSFMEMTSANELSRPMCCTGHEKAVPRKGKEKPIPGALMHCITCSSVKLVNQFSKKHFKCYLNFNACIMGWQILMADLLLAAYATKSAIKLYDTFNIG